MHHKPPQLRDLLLSYKIKGKTAILFFFYGFSFGLNLTMEARAYVNFLSRRHFLSSSIVEWATYANEVNK